MGKNHRHKKNVKADKAKIKLKQTKTQFLPKGLNETKATFKIKPIVLPEQLREKSSNVPLSKRKLNIMDLFNRIKHHNENVRHSACEELTEMYKQFSKDIITDHLHDLILYISNLIQDRERKVRTATIKLITVVLELTPGEKLEPFFNYFSAHLCCAMTHLDQGIQEDSLKFLDCFLNKDCGFILLASEKILPNFFTLISRLKSESAPGRTLTINLGSKLTSVAWRIRVLGRLHAMLDIILKKKEQKNERNLDCFENHSNTLHIYKSSFYKALENPNWTGLNKNVASQIVLQNHLLGLIPVFYDIWMEVMPDKKVFRSAEESTYLRDDAASILCSIVNTMYLLWKYIEKIETADSNLQNIFVSPEATKFLNYLLTNFPYRKMDAPLKRKSNIAPVELNNDTICVKVNLIICYIYFGLNTKFSRTSSNAEMRSIFNYINKCLQTKNYINQNNIQHVIEFINLAFVEHYQVWKKCKVDCREILVNLLLFCNSKSLGERNKWQIFKILIDLTDNQYMSRSSNYQLWLSSLPELLYQPSINDLTAENLLQLARKNCTTFLTAVKSNMLKILTNLKKLNIVLTKQGYKDYERVRRDVAYIFYYVNDFSCFEVKQINNFLSDCISSQDCFVIRNHLHRCPSTCQNLD